MEDKLRSLLKDKLKQIDTPANKTKRTAIWYIRTAIPFSQETSGETHNIGKLVPGMANNARWKGKKHWRTSVETYHIESWCRRQETHCIQRVNTRNKFYQYPLSWDFVCSQRTWNREFYCIWLSPKVRICPSASLARSCINRRTFTNKLTEHKRLRIKIKGPSHPCKNHWTSSLFEKQCQNYADLQSDQMHQD